MKSEQRTGKAGEELATSVLRSLGIQMVEKIGTPIVAIPASKGTFKIIWGEKVSGDRRGIMPDGRSVLAECKTILDRNLLWSDLREHQPGCLDLHTKNHGLSLLVWVHTSGVYVMEWPVAGFGPRKSVTIEAAHVHDMHTREMLKEYGR